MTTLFNWDEFDILFSNIFESHTGFGPIQDGSVKIGYPVDILKRTDGLELQIAALGLKKDDIEISIEGDILGVKYDKKARDIPESDYIARHITRKSFNHAWKIGAKFELDNLEAKLENGLLTIKIPIKESAQTRKVKIK